MDMKIDHPSQQQVDIGASSASDVPNDPGKMFIGGLSWQTSPVPKLFHIKHGACMGGATLEAGDTESGCTVHFVDEGVDTGAIIVQSSVPILAGDTEEKLTKRIQVAEHFAFPKALRLLATGAVKLSKEGKTVFV